LLAAAVGVPAAGLTQWHVVNEEIAGGREWEAPAELAEAQLSAIIDENPGRDGCWHLVHRTLSSRKPRRH
jgi:hypothetical protein